MKSVKLIIIILIAQQFAAQSQSLFPIQKKGKWGYGDLFGKKILVAPQFEYAESFKRDDYPAIVGKDCDSEGKNCKKFALINQKGKLITGFDYDKIEISNGYLSNEGLNDKLPLVKLKKNGKVGLIDFMSERELLPCNADYVYESYFGGNLLYSHKGYIIYKRNGKFGVLNRDGSVYISEKYDSIYPGSSSGNFLMIEENRKKGVHFFDGTIIPPKFDGLYSYNYYSITSKNNNLVVKNAPNFQRWIVSYDNGKYGLLNRKGEELIACELDEPLPFPDLFYIKSVDGYYGVTDFYGFEIVPYQFDYIKAYISDYAGYCNCDFYAVKKNGKYGAYSEAGKLLLNTEYDTILNGVNRTTLFYNASIGKYVGINDSCQVLQNPDLKAYKNFLRDKEKLKAYLAEMERRMHANASGALTNNLAGSNASSAGSCTCCEGTGKSKTDKQAVYETCYQCGGTGYYGYEYKSPMTGQDRARWYGGPGWGKSICSVCKGSKKSYARSERITCKCCNGSGKN